MIICHVGPTNSHSRCYSSILDGLVVLSKLTFCVIFERVIRYRHQLMTVVLQGLALSLYWTGWLCETYYTFHTTSANFSPPYQQYIKKSADFRNSDIFLSIRYFVTSKDGAKIGEILEKVGDIFSIYKRHWNKSSIDSNNNPRYRFWIRRGILMARRQKKEKWYQKLYKPKTHDINS